VLSPTIWNVIWDFLILSILLLTASIIRSRVPIVQRTLMPNALIAGMIGLIFSWPGIIHFSAYLSDYVFHLLNITFASIALFSPLPSKDDLKGGVLSTMIYMNFILGIQILVGSLATILFFKRLHPTFGILMGIGYAAGPGQAYAIGSSLEQYGLTKGGNIGIIFGSIGFLWAYFAGMALIHWGIRKRKATFISSLDGVPDDVWTGILKRKEIAGYKTTADEAIDSLAIQLSFIGLIYLITIFLIGKITSLFPSLEVLWGLTFAFTVFIGAIVRYLLEGVKMMNIVDSGLQRRIAGTSTDYLIVAALCSIQLPVVRAYITPIIIIALLGGIATLFFSIWLAPRIWDHTFERMVICFGVLTGTMSSGIMLGRIVDPLHRSRAVVDYACGMIPGLLFFWVPLFIVVYMLILKESILIYLIIVAIFTFASFLMWRIFGIWTGKNWNDL